MKLRRFSQLGWHGCMDLVAAAAGHHVQRVELGEPPRTETEPDLHPAQKRFLEGEPMKSLHVPGVRRGRRWGMS